MMLVTVQQCSDRIRRDSTADDDDLAQMIATASGILHAYMGELAPYLDSDGAAPVDSDGIVEGVDEVVAGTVISFVAWMYRHRDEDPAKAFADGRLPEPVRAFIGQFHDPVLA